MDDRIRQGLRNGQLRDRTEEQATCGCAVSGAKHHRHGSTLSEISFDPERNARAPPKAAHRLRVAYIERPE
jgi:hypothetical protein